MEARAIQWEPSNLGRLYSVGVGVGPWLTLGISFALREGTFIVEVLCFALQIQWHEN